MLRHFQTHVMAVSAQFKNMKLNAPDDLIFKDEAFFYPISLMQTLKDIFRFSLPLFCLLVMIKIQNDYFAENVSA